MHDKYNMGGILVNDPTKVINTIPSNSNGLFSAVNNDPWENPMQDILDRVKKLETDNKFLRLKILSIEV